MVLLVMPQIGSCIALADDVRDATPIAISKAVGQGGAANLPNDVKTIQDALNQVTVKGFVGGAMPFLVVDGLVGPKTIGAITNFQRQQVKAIMPDGRVDPGKKTILRLNELLVPVSKFDLNEKLAKALPLVRSSLDAAILNLSALGRGGTTATSAADRLQRHFLINAPNGNAQSLGLLQTYQLMAKVVNDPTTFGMFGAIDAFDVDKTNAKIALTNSLGLFEPVFDKKGESNKARRIRLGLGFFAPNVTPEFAAFILVHELAHFTGRFDKGDIRDKGRGWFDDTFIRPLPTPQRLLNADSYATFAEECRTGSSTKPNFVKTAPGGLGGAR